MVNPIIGVYKVKLICKIDKIKNITFTVLFSSTDGKPARYAIEIKHNKSNLTPTYILFLS
jgi:hypothetical protein